MSKLVKWIIGVAIAVVVLAVAGPFVYINFIQGEPEAAFSVDQITTTSGASNPSSNPSSATPLTGIDGTWSIADGSQAGYRIKEILLGQSTEAVGRTDEVTGQLTASGTTISAASFSVDMASVSSDDGTRDGQFRGRIMNTSKFPTATFTLTSPIDIGSIPPDGQQITVKATGDLALHGVTKPVTFDLTAQKWPEHPRRRIDRHRVSPTTTSTTRLERPRPATTASSSAWSSPRPGVCAKTRRIGGFLHKQGFDCQRRSSTASHELTSMPPPFSTSRCVTTPSSITAA
jgi:polyisoprenoid-binding protein YceI